MKDKVFCIIAARYFPYLGGVERYAYNIAREIVNSGNKAIVVTSCMNTAPVYECQEGIKIYRLPSFGLLKERFPMLLYNQKTKKLIKRLDKEKIDYMVVNTRFYLLSLFGTAYARKRKIPSIVIEHGTGHFTVNNPLWDFAGHIYEHIITNLIKRECKDFYGVSLACNQWLEHFKISARGVLYNAIDFQQIERLYISGDNKNVWERVQYEKEDFIITYTGRLVKEKGIQKLIAAFRDIKKNYPNTKLCIAGDGEMFGEIVKDITEGIFLLGKLEFSDVIQLLKISKIYVLPTDYPEGLPTSILEAMACKVYVITSKAGGAKEVILDDTYGKIMQDNTTAEIRNSIIDILKNEAKRVQVAEHGFERVKEVYVWSKTCKKLMDVFNGR